MSGLTHFDGEGHAHMVDVSSKPVTNRVATAVANVKMASETFDIISEGRAKKGDVLAVARLAGIMGAKKTPDLIPLCHPLPVTKVSVELTLDPDLPGVQIAATVKTTGQTGVEMEALTAASTAALTVYDMVKAVDRAMEINGLRVTLKDGGKIGPVRSAMISVDEALWQLFALVEPLELETVPLAEASGRVLGEDGVARRDQPPFAASAMDGYAVKSAEVAPGAHFNVIGEAAAGHGFSGTVGSGQAVRIFTGAPVPDGSDRVVIQEDVTRENDRITLSDALDKGPHIRAKAADFAEGTRLKAPRKLSPADVALLAAMNIPEVAVARRPVVALISTGDELVMPGEPPGPDQIIASNTFGLKAMLEEMGAAPRILPIARDTRASLHAAFDLAEGADLIVTIGGASVGDHDLVGDVVAELGMDRAFYKVRMRPGKPLMAGRMGKAAMVGLPGNPVSAMVCGHVFIAPMIRAMLGLGKSRTPQLTARLSRDMDASGPREHYMRAEVQNGSITPEPRQDSALLSVLARANALMIRPAGDGPRRAGDEMAYLPL